MIIVDAHEDLAYNVLADGRNYLQSAYDTRVQEQDSYVSALIGDCMLGLPEWLQGGVAVIFSTLFTMPRHAAKSGEMSYVNSEGAYQQAFAQLNIYRRWHHENGRLRLITRRPHLETVLESWSGDEADEKRQVGFVLLMENAAPIRTPAEVGWWYEQGVRLIGPAWQANIYTGSDEDSAPLTDLGRDLLDEMAKYQIILDISHMSDSAAAEALDRYTGPVVATHANPRRIIPTPRMLPDSVIEKIIEKDGVIGLMPANWALKPNWDESSGKDSVQLADLVRAIDTVCQIAGDAFHVGLGTDFDGGFGVSATPAELDTIADLPRLADALASAGYRDDYIAAIMGGNWLRVLWQSLPAE